MRAGPGAAALAALLLAGCEGAGPATPPPSPPAEGPPTLPVPVATPAVDDDREPEPAPIGPVVEDPDFRPLGEPGPGDWLSRIDEPGQTPGEYRLSCSNRRTPDRDRIVLRPLGSMAEAHAGLLEKVREYLGIYYGVETTVAAPLPLPEHARVPERRQYDGDRILVELRNSIPGDALAYVGFCGEDLFSGDLGFVFGVGALDRRVGVYSLARYGTEPKARLGRALKVAAHEVGHILGMKHCIRYACCMNGANSVREMDGRPPFLCPECREKARWNTGFDPAARYAALARFLEREGFAEEAAFARRRAAKAAGRAAAREE